MSLVALQTHFAVAGLVVIGSEEEFLFGRELTSGVVFFRIGSLLRVWGVGGILMGSDFWQLGLNLVKQKKEEKFLLCSPYFTFHHPKA